MSVKKKSLVGYVWKKKLTEFKWDTHWSKPNRVQIPNIFRSAALFDRLERKWIKVRITIEEVK
jgi:hypothetical protein